jgi:uncharacterized surface protein with fasciclin (FAS1) repeats
VQGGEVTITVLNGLIYVNDAKIIAPDYLINNGVIHLLERYLGAYLDFSGLVFFDLVE